MPVEIESLQDGKVLVVHLSGKLTSEDYQRLTPAIESAINWLGKINIVFNMKNFHGWDASALWEDVKFEAKHFRHIDRLAMVGDKAWQKGMAIFCKPFTSASIRYFDVSEEAEARAWVQEEG